MAWARLAHVVNEMDYPQLCVAEWWWLDLVSSYDMFHCLPAAVDSARLGL